MGADLNAIFEATASVVVNLNGCRIINAIVKNRFARDNSIEVDGGREIFIRRRRLSTSTRTGVKEELSRSGD
jgi:hypothetical protein